MNELERKTLGYEVIKRRNYALSKIREISTFILANEHEKVERIVEDYRGGLTLECLAKKYLPEDLNEKSRNVAMGVIYNILRNKLNKRKRRKLKYEHWTNSGLFVVRNSLGVYGRSRTKINEDSQKAAIKKGQTPWYDLPYREDFDETKHMVYTPEIAFAYNLFLNHWTYSSIKAILNEAYHNGKNIRTTISVERKLHTFRKGK